MKSEVKEEEEKFIPSASVTNPKMSVGHTPTTQPGAVRRPPPPPGGSGRGSPLLPQDGTIGGQPPPGQNQPGNAQKGNETGLPTTLESCKILFNNDLQEKILLFSHHLKQPYDQATGNKIEQYFNQLIFITAKLEKFADHANNFFKYKAMQEEYMTKSNSIGNLMVTCQNYLGKSKTIPTPFTPTFHQTSNINPNFTPISSANSPQQQRFTPNQGLNPNVHFNPNFGQAFQNQNSNQNHFRQNFPHAPQFPPRNNVSNFQKQFKPEKLLHSFNITEFRHWKQQYACYFYSSNLHNCEFA